MSLGLAVKGHRYRPLLDLVPWVIRMHQTVSYHLANLVEGSLAHNHFRVALRQQCGRDGPGPGNSPENDLLRHFRVVLGHAKPEIRPRGVRPICPRAHPRICGATRRAMLDARPIRYLRPPQPHRWHVDPAGLGRQAELLT